MEQQHKYRQQLQYKYQHAGGDEGGTSGACTFCGAPLDNDERFCPDCGNPRGGITCPRCGTVSHRSFCSRCNTPLNELAREAVKQAKADPAFRRAEQLAAEMAELEGQILNAGMPEARLDTTPNHEARKAAGRYADLFAGVTSLKVPDPPVVQSGSAGKVLTGNLLQTAINAYKEKAAELQRTISSMLPPPSATPEEQRNFFCARKIMTVEMRATRQEWVCNYCGCHHNQPSECAEPQLGGTWLFVNQPTPVAKIIYG